MGFRLDNITQLTFISHQPNVVDGLPIVNVNVHTTEDLLTHIDKQIQNAMGFSLATINLDHIVKMRFSEAFRSAYKAQDIIVADGFPIVWIGKMLGATIERTTGADTMLPMIALAIKHNRPIAIVGTPSHVLDSIVNKLKSLYPALTVSFAQASTPGFDPQSKEADDLLTALENSGAALCFLAYGAPTQEILAARGRRIAPHVGFVSVGGALDILIGRQKRAPVWMQRANLEWLWRLLQKPLLRLPRYWACACVFPFLMATSYLKSKRA